MMMARQIGERTAGAHPAPETWVLTDRTTGRQLGSKAYPTLARASEKRRQLIEAARGVSRETAEDAARRCDIRRLP